MTDQYEELRAALAAGPAIGPYIVDQDNGNGIVVVDGRGYIVAEANYGDVPSEYGPGVTETIIRDVRSTHLYIAAANPETISKLLAERDALLQRLRDIVESVKERDREIERRARAMEIRSERVKELTARLKQYEPVSPWGGAAPANEKEAE